MKKKDIHSKLSLRKHVISNFDMRKVRGGTNTIAYPITITIRLTTRITKPDMCESLGDNCTLFCETKDSCYCSYDETCN